MMRPSGRPVDALAYRIMRQPALYVLAVMLAPLVLGQTGCLTMRAIEDTRELTRRSVPAPMPVASAVSASGNIAIGFGMRDERRVDHVLVVPRASLLEALTAARRERAVLLERFPDPATAPVEVSRRLNHPPQITVRAIGTTPDDKVPVRREGTRIALRVAETPPAWVRQRGLSPLTHRRTLKFANSPDERGPYWIKIDWTERHTVPNIPGLLVRPLILVPSAALDVVTLPIQAVGVALYVGLFATGAAL